MKIFKVEIENYRQYIGKNVVEMSVDSDKNFSIIQGTNGRGKSNFMNAIIWCLYNEEPFRSKNSEGREKLNEHVLETMTLGETVDVSVAVEIGEERSKYRFLRKVSYKKYSNGINQDNPTFKLFEIDDAKGYIGKDSPDWYVKKKFIPKDLREFFFFDGEKMTEYFEDVSEVKSSVEKLAQIDTLKNSIETLKGTLKLINNKIKEKKPSTGTTTDQQNDYITKILNGEERLEQINKRNIEIENSLSQIEEYLRKNSDEKVKKLQTDLDDARKQRAELINNIDANDKKLRSLIAERAPIVFSSKALSYSKDLIAAETERGILPPNVKDVFLRELLDSGICICGRSLEEGSAHRHEVEELLLRVMPSDISYEASAGKYAIADMLKKADFRTEYHEYRKNKLSFEEKLDKLSKKIESTEDELNAYDVDEIQEKIKSQNKLKNERRALDREEGGLKSNIEIWKEQYELNKKTIDEALKSEEILKKLGNQKNYTDSLIKALEEVKNTLVEEVRAILEKKTKEYFLNMIEEKEKFSDVKIIEQGNFYKFSVKTQYGRECLADLSAGEKQVLALSFTCALHDVSGYSVPIMIDTPLGRISEESRSKIASHLPTYLSDSQVILLATDTEYTESVRNVLHPSVGAEYRIQYDKSLKTSKVIPYER